MRGRRLRVTGKVQGVWFRAWAVEQARELGVTGWVRNRGDGSVEMVATGEGDALEEFERRCRVGPPRARVEAVAVEPSDEQVSSAFERRADA